MNYLFTSMRYWPAVGGAETQFRELARLMATQDPVTVLTQSTDQKIDNPLRHTTLDSKEVQHFQDGPVDVHVVTPERRKRWLIKPMMALAHRPQTKKLGLRLYRSAFENAMMSHVNKADLIYNILLGTEYYSTLSWHVARRAKIPFVIRPMVHPGAWGDSPFLFDMYRRADAVIALLDTEKKYYESMGVPSERIHVVGIFPLIEPVPNPDIFRVRHQIKGRMILFVGRKVAYKGYQTLLECAPRLWVNYPDATFVFIGPDEADETSNALADEWLDDPRVRSIGMVTEQEKAEALAACDVLCLPSRHEIFPSVILEAWHFSKPVVVGDIPYLRDLVDEGESGLISAQNPEVLSEGLTKMFDHPDLMLQYGSRGHEKFQRHYTKEAVVKNMRRVFEQLLNKV